MALLSPAVMRANRARSETYNQTRFADAVTTRKFALPIFLSVGTDDNRAILKWVPRTRDALRRDGADLTYRDDFSGDHKSFHAPEGKFMDALFDFLKSKL